MGTLNFLISGGKTKKSSQFVDIQVSAYRNGTDVNTSGLQNATQSITPVDPDNTEIKIWQFRHIASGVGADLMNSSNLHYIRLNEAGDEVEVSASVHADYVGNGNSNTEVMRWILEVVEYE